MSHRDKLEQVLALFINEETEQATELLHQIMVEKARNVYESIIEEEDQVSESEEVGGDVTTDFIDDIEQDKDEIESDEVESEYTDGEESIEGEEEEEVEDRVESLEDQLSELEAKFDALFDEEMEEPQHADLADEFGYSDEEEDYDEEVPMEGLKEATKLSDAVAGTGQESEGKHAGTGKNSKDAAVSQKAAPYTNAPSRKDYGGKPTSFSKDVGAGKEADKSSRKDDGFGAGDNIGVGIRDERADLSGEGKFAGTGKNSKGGKVEAQAPFTKKPE